MPKAVSVYSSSRTPPHQTNSEPATDRRHKPGGHQAAPATVVLTYLLDARKTARALVPAWHRIGRCPGVRVFPGERDRVPVPADGERLEAKMALGPMASSSSVRPTGLPNRAERFRTAPADNYALKVIA
jgi:hypothetical protein